MNKQSHININVSKDGIHFFDFDSTDPEWKVVSVVMEIKKRFPENEGFEISVTEWKCAGKEKSLKHWFNKSKGE